jgi:pilus assembly protein TadC
MFTMKCPKCEARISILICRFKEVRQKTRKCPFCGVHFKLSNPVFMGTLFGLLIGGGLIIAKSCNISFLLRTIVIFLVIFPLPLFVIKIFGQWEISEKN